MEPSTEHDVILAHPGVACELCNGVGGRFFPSPEVLHDRSMEGARSGKVGHGRVIREEERHVAADNEVVIWGSTQAEVDAACLGCRAHVPASAKNRRA